MFSSLPSLSCSNLHLCFAAFLVLLAGCRIGVGVESTVGVRDCGGVGRAGGVGDAGCGGGSCTRKM
jgi:hypothetical protein